MNDHQGNDAEIPQRNIDDVRPGLIFVVGLVTTILVVVIIICTQAWFNAQQKAAQAAVSYGVRPEQISEYLTEEHEKLNRMRWADTDKSAAQLPLDQAMEIYLKQHVESTKN
ncbi:hypothetical protein HED60_19890 [Planctomycetales bacterium ZRK34]|nr:hypothetical protein HED60_19890 [Planctomycetales bacterium ZRK34]